MADVDEAINAYCELLRIGYGTWPRFQAEPAMIYFRERIASELGLEPEVVQVACEEAAATAKNDTDLVYTRFASKPDFGATAARLSQAAS